VRGLPLSLLLKKLTDVVSKLGLDKPAGAATTAGAAAGAETGCHDVEAGCQHLSSLGIVNA
jgi:hypothetical protein